MSSILNQFEQFLILFENLKTVAGEPKRLATFDSESSAIRDAAKRLEESALDLTHNLEWFGQKRLRPVRSQFEQAWLDYQTQWVPAIKCEP